MQGTETQAVKQAWERGGEPIPFARAADPAMAAAIIRRLEAEYDTVHVTSLGESIYGTAIPVITLGARRESRGVLYIGGADAGDAVSTAVLLRFVRDYADYLATGRRVVGVSLPYLYETRTIHVVPMLNPDGHHIRRHGAEGLPNENRLRVMAADGDFSAWRHNGRGADIRSNFFGARAESEPESAALAQYIRMGEHGVLGAFGLVMELIGGAREMHYTSGGVIPARGRTIARLLSRMTDATLVTDTDIGGTLTDYVIRTLGKPGVICGLGEISASVTDSYLYAYTAFREALFSAPLLI